MEETKPNRSLWGSLFHVVDKTVDPMPYVTDELAASISQKIISFNTHETRNKFVLDETTLKNIHMAFEREAKLLAIVENEINNGTYSKIEQIKKDVRPGYFSQALNAVIAGYQENTLKTAEATVQILKNTTKSINTAIKTKDNEKESIPLVANQTLGNSISPISLEELILNSNSGYFESACNLIKKTITDPIGYLTSSKSITVADEVIRFDPSHQKYEPLNPKLPLHKKLIHNALERESRLLKAIETALRNNNYADIFKIKQSVNQGYISQHVDIILSSYLTITTQRKEKDNQIRRRKRSHSSIKKELQDAITQANAICEELVKELPQITNKDLFLPTVLNPQPKTSALTEQLKSAPIEIKNTLRQSCDSSKTPKKLTPPTIKASSLSSFALEEEEKPESKSSQESIDEVLKMGDVIENYNEDQEEEK